MHISDFNGYPDGTDTTPALNAAVSAAIATDDKTIYFSAGQYSFQTIPNAFPSLIRLVGQGLSATVFRRAYSGGKFLTLTGNGCGVKDLTLYANSGTSGGYGIHMIASDTLGAGGNHQIENVWITGKGTWAIPLFLDGINKLQAPAGLRTVHLTNVSVFNATLWAAEFWNCVSCEWFGGGAYQGFGTTQALAVGGALGTKNRIDANIDWAASTVWAGQMRGPGK